MEGEARSFASEKSRMNHEREGLNSIMHHEYIHTYLRTHLNIMIAGEKCRRERIPSSSAGEQVYHPRRPTRGRVRRGS